MATDRSKKTKALADKSKDMVMLAHKFSEKKHVIDATTRHQVSIKGWLASEKIDGIRAIFKDGELISRYGNKFYAPPEFIEAIEDSLLLEHLDGELVSVNGFQDTASIVRDQTKKVSMEFWKNIRYRVFDINKEGTYKDRISELESKYTSNRYVKLHKCDHTVRSVEGLMKYTSKITDAGGEGAMLRNPDSLYVTGRSWNLLKIKKFDDLEAKVIGYYDGEGKYEGMIGGLICSMGKDTTFEVGTGLTDEDRASPPAIGAMVTIKYMGLTDKEKKPRHPVYISTRDYE